MKSEIIHKINEIITRKSNELGFIIKRKRLC